MKTRLFRLVPLTALAALGFVLCVSAQAQHSRGLQLYFK